MKNYCQLPLIIFLVVALVSCRSSRHASKEADVDAAGTVTGKDSKSFNGQGISAKLKLKLDAGDKSISCGGTYCLLRDEMVQINLTYTVFVVSVNVGTLELTKEGVLLLDKIDKRYCRAKYEDIPALESAGINFEYMQRIFWGDAEDLSNSYVDFTYGDRLQLNGGKFPQEIAFTFKDKDFSKYKVALELSKVQETTERGTRTEIPSGFEEVSPQTVVNAIMRVAK